MKIDFNELQTRSVLKYFASVGLTIAGFVFATNNAYNAGCWSICKRMEEKGLDPEEVLGDDKE